MSSSTHSDFTGKEIVETFFSDVRQSTDDPAKHRPFERSLFSNLGNPADLDITFLFLGSLLTLPFCKVGERIKTLTGANDIYAMIDYKGNMKLISTTIDSHDAINIVTYQIYANPTLTSTIAFERRDINNFLDSLKRNYPTLTDKIFDSNFMQYVTASYDVFYETSQHKICMGRSHLQWSETLPESNVKSTFQVSLDSTIPPENMIDSDLDKVMVTDRAVSYRSALEKISNSFLDTLRYIPTNMMEKAWASYLYGCLFFNVQESQQLGLSIVSHQTSGSPRAVLVWGKESVSGWFSEALPIVCSMKTADSTPWQTIDMIETTRNSIMQSARAKQLDKFINIEITPIIDYHSDHYSTMRVFTGHEIMSIPPVRSLPDILFNFDATESHVEHLQHVEVGLRNLLISLAKTVDLKQSLDAFVMGQLTSPADNKNHKEITSYLFEDESDSINKHLSTFVTQHHHQGLVVVLNVYKNSASSATPEFLTNVNNMPSFTYPTGFRSVLVIDIGKTFDTISTNQEFFSISPELRLLTVNDGQQFRSGKLLEISEDIESATFLKELRESNIEMTEIVETGTIKRFLTKTDNSPNILHSSESQAAFLHGFFQSSLVTFQPFSPTRNIIGLYHESLGAYLLQIADPRDSSPKIFMQLQQFLATCTHQFDSNVGKKTNTKVFSLLPESFLSHEVASTSSSSSSSQRSATHMNLYHFDKDNFRVECENTT